MQRSVLMGGGCTSVLQWPMFDPDGSMSIDRAEFAMRDGLAETLSATMAYM